MNDFLKTEVDIKAFAKNLAHSDDINQADLLNKFAYELRVCCRDSDFSGMQACAISEKLDLNGVLFINALAEFIKLRQEYKPK